MLFLYSLNIKSQDNTYVDFEKKFDTELVYNIYAKLKPKTKKLRINMKTLPYETKLKYKFINYILHI